jgi:hypothetical protein
VACALYQRSRISLSRATGFQHQIPRTTPNEHGDDNGNDRAGAHQHLRNSAPPRKAAESSSSGPSGTAQSRSRAQLSAIFHFDDDATWAKANAIAEAAVSAAQKGIESRCLEIGIPKQFAPGISMGWYGRGENACPRRRAELRKLADARIESMLRDAIVQIETRSVELQEQVMAGGFTTDAAAKFLDALPSPDSLMPPVDVQQLMLTKTKNSQP